MALALVATPFLARAQSMEGMEFVVRGKGNAETLAAMLGSKGKVVARERVPNAYRIRLASGLGVDFAKRLFAPGKPFQYDRFAGMTRMFGSLDPESSGSIKGFLSKFDWIKGEDEHQEEEEERKKNPGKSGEEGEEGEEKPDALAAKLYRLRELAFPYDKIDPTSQMRGAAQLEKLRGSRDFVTNGSPAPTQNWTFIGPKNLDIPYRVYYGTPPLSGRVNAVAYDPATTSTIYAGAAQGGLWKSIDSGANWKCVSDNDAWPVLPVNSITVNPADPQEIFVGIGDYPGGLSFGSGVMRSKDGGATWKRLSEANGLPPLTGITKTAIAAPGDGQTGTVLIATAGGGQQGGGTIYRSTNDGDTWTQALSSDQTGNVAFTDVAVSARGADNRRWLYAVAPGSNANKRLWVSKDRGATWTVAIDPVAPDPNANPPKRGFSYIPQIGVAAAHDPATGAGSDARRQRVYLLMARPAPDVDPVFTGSNYADAKPPYDSFKLDGNGNPTDYQFNGRVYSSIDGGTTWTDLTDAAFWDRETYNWSQYFYNYHITTGGLVGQGTSNESDDLFIGQIDVFGRRQGGNFQSFGGPTYAGSSVLHNDQHAAAVNPQNPNELLVGNDGGVFRINVASGTPAVTSLNKTMGISQFYHASWHPTDPTKALGGTQDNASPAAVGDLGTWQNVGAGDGGFSIINRATPNKQFTSYQYLGAYNGPGGLTFSLIATDDGWQTGGSTPECTTRTDDNLDFIAPIHLSKANANSMFVGTRYLSRYNTAEATWSPALGGKPWSSDGGEVAERIETATTTEETILVSTNYGRLARTLDGGNTWKTINGNLPSAFITGMSIDFTNAKQAVITLGRQDTTPHVWASDDITVDTPVWRDVSYKINGQEIELSAQSIERDFDSPSDTWYVGTLLGVMFTNDGGKSYKDLTAANGLPRAEVRTLYANSKLRTIEAATYGRGMWRLQKEAPPAPAALQKVVFVPTKIRVNDYTQGTVTLKSNAPKGGAVVNVVSKYEDALRLVAQKGSTQAIGTVRIPEGSKTATFYGWAVPTQTQPSKVRVVTFSGDKIVENYIQIINANLNATVVYQDLVPGGTPPRKLSYTIRTTTGAVVGQGSVVAGNGAFTLNNVPAGMYTITVRGGTFLGRKVAFDTTNSDPTVKLSLLNGDVNGDNKVDSADAAIVTKALGSSAGQPKWNISADLNKDGKVDAADQAIVQKNNGKVGAP
ncbi:hypothetical protein BH11ARM2_BH11ARM2_05830 [soil metagenome]